MKPRSFAIAAGILLVLVGFILGITRTSISTTSRNPFDEDLVTSASVTCGSVFSPGAYVPLGVRKVEVAPLCDDAVSSRAVWVWVLIGGGALLAVGGAVIRPGRPLTVA